MRILNFQNMFNIRDIGGYKTEDGFIIKDNVLLRSDAPKEMSEDDLSYLIANDIHTEIDLRTLNVAANHPSSLALDGRFDYISFPIKEGSQETLENATISELYMKMIENHENIANIFKTIIYQDGGIVLNCTAGKDRTGVVVAILLLALNVDKNIVFDDYEISEQLINKNILGYCETHQGFPTSLGFSKREYIMEFYLLLKQKYGDATNYLRIIGLSDNDLENMKAKFLTKN